MRAPHRFFRLLLLSVACCLAASAAAQQSAPGVTFFSGTWEQLLAKAKTENKPFFVDVYTTWCGPCKVMDKRTFADPSIGTYANSHYIAYKLDAEKGQGPALAQKYRVTGYPTVLFFDAEGKLIGRSIGLLGPDDFLVQLQGYKERTERQGDAMKTASPEEKAKLGRLFEKQ